MALNTGNADAVATAFCTANSITDPTAVGLWKSFCRNLYVSAGASSLVTAIQVTVPPAAITTVGSATTQVGPPAPVPLTVS